MVQRGDVESVGVGREDRECGGREGCTGGTERRGRRRREKVSGERGRRQSLSVMLIPTLYRENGHMIITLCIT